MPHSFLLNDGDAAPDYQHPSADDTLDFSPMYPLGRVSGLSLGSNEQIFVTSEFEPLLGEDDDPDLKNTFQEVLGGNADGKDLDQEASSIALRIHDPETADSLGPDYEYPSDEEVLVVQGTDHECAPPPPDTLDFSPMYPLGRVSGGLSLGSNEQMFVTSEFEPLLGDDDPDLKNTFQDVLGGNADEKDLYQEASSTALSIHHPETADSLATPEDEVASEDEVVVDGEDDSAPPSSPSRLLLDPPNAETRQTVLNDEHQETSQINPLMIQEHDGCLRRSKRKRAGKITPYAPPEHSKSAKKRKRSAVKENHCKATAAGICLFDRIIGHDVFEKSEGVWIWRVKVAWRQDENKPTKYRPTWEWLGSFCDGADADGLAEVHMYGQKEKLLSLEKWDNKPISNIWESHTLYKYSNLKP